MTDAMILYARHILGEKHLKSWYQQFGYQDQIGQVAMKGWQCLICEEIWTRTYKPDPKLQGSPPQVIRALFYSAISHHKEAHSRDAQELKASQPPAGEGQPPPHVDVASPPSPAEPCLHIGNVAHFKEGEEEFAAEAGFYCMRCKERVG